MTLAATFGTKGIKCWDVGWKDFAKNLDEKICLEAALRNMVKPVLVGRFTYHGPITQVPPDSIKEATIIAGHLGIDIDKLFADASEAIPEPKAWANLKADGTPKKVKKVKKSKKKKSATVNKTAKKSRKVKPSDKKSAGCQLH